MKHIDNIKIILADDHPLVREGICSRFEEISYINIIDTATDGVELLAKIKQNQPDIAIIDISMPKMNGLEVSKKITLMFPKIKILILTMHDNSEYIDHAIKAGADGYILKDISAKKMIKSIETIYNGGKYFPEQINDIPQQINTLTETFA